MVHIIYASQYGNTEKVAKAIGSALGDARVLLVKDATANELTDLDMLIIGSPTQGGRPTPELQKFLTAIPDGALKGMRVVAFDTRFSNQDHGVGLRLLMKVLNFAAPKIAKILEAKGGTLVVPPEGFYVTGKEGPLKPGELERAIEWAKSLRS